MPKILALLLILAWCCKLHADIQSSTGSIVLDADSDNNADAVLDASGLGIGTTSASANLHVQGNAVHEGDVMIGATSGNSSLEISGTVGFGVEAVSSNTLLSGNTMVLVDTSSDNIDITLPVTSSANGRVYRIKKLSNQNTLNLTGYIDEKDRVQLTSASNGGLPHISIVSNGSQWYIVDLHSGGNLVTIASDNLIGHWKLDETSSAGNVATDSSVTGNHGTVTGVVSGNIGVAGKAGKAIELDGVNDYIDLTSAPAVDLSLEATFAFWAKRNDTGINFFVFGSGTFTTHAFINIATNLRIETNQNNDRGDATLNPNNTDWHHYAIVCSGLGVTSYQNGSAMTMTDSVITNGNITLDHIGAAVNGTSSQVYGRLDDVRVYDRALTASEVQSLYQIGGE